MQASATRAIRVRLNLWKTFFENGTDGTPRDATDSEYGVDQLVDLARDSGNAELHDLADVVELMAHNYVLGVNHREAEVLMLDDTPHVPTVGTSAAKRIRVSMVELEAALQG